MLTRHNPPTICPPVSRLSLGVEAPAQARWLHVSGQPPLAPDGRAPAGGAAQIERAWLNLLAVLASAGMGPEHLVKVTAFLTDRADVGPYREVRDRLLAGAAPASTIVVVGGFADPDWRVEIEAVAAA